jgi:hypothetical protein
MANEPDAGEEPGTTEEELTDKETSDVDARKIRAEQNDVDDEDDSAGGGMPRITVRMPESQLEELDEFVEESRFINRSEAIRAGASIVVNRERGGA